MALAVGRFYVLEWCSIEATTQGGVAVITRKGAWMAGKELFLKNGFDVAKY